MSDSTTFPTPPFAPSLTTPETPRAKLEADHLAGEEHARDIHDLLLACVDAVSRGVAGHVGPAVQKTLFDPLGRDIATAAFLRLLHDYDTKFAGARQDPEVVSLRALYVQGFLNSIAGSITKVGPYQVARLLGAAAEVATLTVTLSRSVSEEIGKIQSAQVYQAPAAPPPPPPPTAGMSSATAAALRRITG